MSALLLCLAGVVSCGAPEDAAVGDGDLTGVENRGADTENWWDALPREEWSVLERQPSPDDWFEVYAVADGVYAIYEPGQFEEVISYLIVGDDRALLFDSGLGIGDIEAVARSLTSLDIVVMNSHSHYDHIGGNHAFSDILALDTAYTRARAGGSGTGAVAEFISPGWVWKELPDDFDPETYRSRPFSISRFVEDGDVIDLGGRRVEVLVTPGHAPDSLCLIDRENRLLFTGDTFYLAPLYTHLEGSDFERYAESAARLSTLADDVDVLLTAHNVPLVDSGYLLELDAAFQTIKAGKGSYVVTDGSREYDFGSFSVIVRTENVTN